MSNLPTVPQLTHPLGKTDVDALMRTLRQMQAYMQEQARFVPREFVLQAPTDEAPRVAIGTAVRPKSVLLAAFDQIRPEFGAVGITETLRWEYDRGHLILPQFAALPGTGTYRLRLLVEEA